MLGFVLEVEQLTLRAELYWQTKSMSSSDECTCGRMSRSMLGPALSPMLLRKAANLGSPAFQKVARKGRI